MIGIICLILIIGWGLNIGLFIADILWGKIPTNRADKVMVLVWSFCFCLVPYYFAVARLKILIENKIGRG